MPSPTELRSDIAALASIAADDLAAMWEVVSSAAEARVALMDLLPALVEVYGDAAAAIAADWYDDLRVEVAAPRRFTPVLPGPSDRGAQALAGWATAPWLGVPDDEIDWTALRQRVAGGLQRRISDTARDTIVLSSIDDPAADGWQRVARSGGCPFCVMLAGRGAVYTKSTADFASHDECNCVATVAWSGEERPVKPYVASARNITDADRARVREWIAANQ